MSIRTRLPRIASGDWNSPEAVLKAARYAERIREECLDARQSLAFETVFSTEGKLSFVRRAIDRGFFVRLFYVSTDDPRHQCRPHREACA